MDILLFFRVLIGVLLVAHVFKTISRNGIIINHYWCGYIIFYLFFVFSDLVFALCGRLNLDLYIGYRFIAENNEIDLLYLLLVVTLYCWFYRIAIKNKKQIYNLSFKKHYINLSIELFLVLFFMTWIPIILVLLSPNPELYFTKFAPFYTDDYLTNEEIYYQWNVLTQGLRFSCISVIALWLYSQKNRYTKSGKLLRLYLGFIWLQILIFSNKRTIGFLLLALMVLVDILYVKKKSYTKILIMILFVWGYFVIYQFLSGKPMMGGADGGVFELYALYLTREIDLKLVIYSCLYPQSVKILDWPGVTFLYDFLFFIPRELWLDKPYSFGVYYTAAWKGMAVANVSSLNLTSWFAECLANFSILGIPLAMFIYRKMMDFFNTINDRYLYVYSIFLCVCFLITMVGSNFVFISFFVVLCVLKKMMLILQYKKK